MTLYGLKRNARAWGGPKETLTEESYLIHVVFLKHIIYNITLLESFPRMAALPFTMHADSIGRGARAPRAL